MPDCAVPIVAKKSFTRPNHNWPFFAFLLDEQKEG
jgi:hypothetical protein